MCPMQSCAIIYAMNTPIDLRRTQHAVWLAQELSFSRAAQRAHLAQTAFSRSIQALEASLGLQLFDRSTRHVVVTAVGVQWLAQAQAALSQADNLSALAADLAQGDGGELCIGASPLAIDCGVVEALLALRQRRPRLQLQVESGQWQRLREKLLSGQIELFVGYPGTVSDQLHCSVLPLADQPVSVFARAGHPLTQLPQCSPRQLLAYPWAGVQFGAPIRAGLQAILQSSDLPLVLETDSQTLLRSAMLQSDTLLLTWSQWLQADLASARVVDLCPRLHPWPPKELLKLPCAVVHRNDRGLSPAARQLVQLLTPGGE